MSQVARRYNATLVFTWLACSGCWRFTQAPLPSRPIERGRSGPGLLPHALVGKHADHLPLYRQSQIFERDGLDLDRSTLADWVGKATTLLELPADAIGRHVRAGEAIFVDDTPVRMLTPGTGRMQTARLWTYGRDKRPWGGQGAPASLAMVLEPVADHGSTSLLGQPQGPAPEGSPGRPPGLDARRRLRRLRGAPPPRRHPRGRLPGPCPAQARRRASGARLPHRRGGHPAHRPTLRRRGGGPRLAPDRRAAIRQAKARPVFEDLETWLPAQLPAISGKSPLATAIGQALARMARLRPYLEHGNLKLDNNAAERGMRAIARGRKNSLFLGSEAGGRAAAIADTLIETAKLNGVDPQARLANTLARLPDHKITRTEEILPRSRQQ